MKAKRRRRLWIVALVLIPLGALTALVVVPIVGAVLDLNTIADRAHRGRDHLFVETDYEELLAACRDLSRRVASGELTSKQYHVHLGQRDPETLSFPQVILDLEPSVIVMDILNHGEVWIELLPGPDAFGVVAFPEGREGEGDVKLIDGLWYFDGDYSDESPQYRDNINTMIERGRRQRESRSGSL